jgi:hypothetical protein
MELRNSTQLRWTDASAWFWVERPVGVKLQGRRPTTRPQSCCYSVRWLGTEAAQYNPEVRLPFVKAAVTNGLAVTWLLGVRHSDDLQRHQVWPVQDLVAVELDSCTPMQGPVVSGHARVKQAWARYGIRHQRAAKVCKRQAVTAPAPGYLGRGLSAAIDPPRHSCMRRPLLPARNAAVREAFHSKGGSQVTKAVAEQHYVPHGGSIAGSTL